MSKKNEGKPKLRYVYFSSISEMAHIREYGVEKHGGPENWRSTDPVEHAEAAIRHIRAWMEGEKNDPVSKKGSGRSHLAHAMTNLMFEIEREHRLSKENTNESDVI